MTINKGIVSYRINVSWNYIYPKDNETSSNVTAYQPLNVTGEWIETDHHHSQRYHSHHIRTTEQWTTNGQYHLYWWKVLSYSSSVETITVSSWYHHHNNVTNNRHQVCTAEQVWMVSNGTKWQWEGDYWTEMQEYHIIPYHHHQTVQHITVMAPASSQCHLECINEYTHSEYFQRRRKQNVRNGENQVENNNQQHQINANNRYHHHQPENKYQSA